MTIAADPVADDRTPRLPPDAGAICHVIRLSALVWIGWSLVRVIGFWGGRDEVVRAYSGLLKLDLAQLPAAHHAAAFALVLLDWAMAALVVWMVWQLFGHFLRGEIFTRESVADMQCLGAIGVASVAVDMLVRFALPFVLSMHITGAAPAHAMRAEPNDLLHLMMAFFVLALARVFKAGVDIADDHRQIV